MFEDWLFHFILPLAEYVLLAIASLAAFSYIQQALFCVGAATVLLLFIGIHNAWDSVAYHVFINKGETNNEYHRDETSEEDRQLREVSKTKEKGNS